MRLRWIFEVPVAVVGEHDRKKLYCQWPFSTTQGTWERIGEWEQERYVFLFAVLSSKFPILPFTVSPIRSQVLPPPCPLQHLLGMASSFCRNLHPTEHTRKFLYLFGFGQFFG